MTTLGLTQPNLHVALVHFPIALLATGAAIEIFSFLGWRRGGFRLAGRWMILLGALLAPAVTLSGIDALRNAVAAPDDYEQFSSWQEMRSHSQLAADPLAWADLQRHMWLQVAASAAAMMLVLTWIALPDAWRRRLHLGFASLLVVTTAVTLVGAHAGGQLVFAHGVGVSAKHAAPAPSAEEAPPPAPASTVGDANGATTRPATTRAEPALPAEARTPPAAVERASPASATTQPTVDADRVLRIADRLAEYVPPMPAHLVFAGLSLSLSLLAVALSIRRWSDFPPLELPGGPAGPAGQHRGTADSPGDIDPDIDAPWPPGVARAGTPTVPAARFFLLACLLATITGLLGGWYLAKETREVQPRQLWEQIVAPYQNMDANDQPVIPTRRLAHVATGAALVLLPLLLAIVARLAPRTPLLLIGLSTLLLLAIIVQLWLGTLLMLDTNVGPITAFQGS